MPRGEIARNVFTALPGTPYFRIISAISSFGERVVNFLHSCPIKQPATKSNAEFYSKKLLLADKILYDFDKISYIFILHKLFFWIY